MKIKVTILTLLFIYCATTSFQCNKCRTGDLHLDSTKSWLPLKGRTQLFFLDNLGNPTIFNLHIVDTTEIAFNDCGNPYKFQYINATLYLNQSITDSIYFGLSSGGWLCMRAMSNNSPNIVMCNVFGQTKESVIAKRLSNYSIGNRSYQEVILLLHNQGFSDNIDSVFLANNVGIVGFKYSNNKYSLQ
jgi:hypothetical protein